MENRELYVLEENGKACRSIKLWLDERSNIRTFKNFTEKGESLCGHKSRAKDLSDTENVDETR